MAIDFNHTNNTAGLNKTVAQSVRQNSAQLSTTAREQSSTSEASDQPVGSGESVQLSQDARQLQSLTQKISAQPSVNADKVAQLKQAIAEGSYHIDNQRVASKLLKLEAQF